jgi:lysophospholipase L1-like esterase
MKILIRGGSISAGYGVTRSYVDILQERFQKFEFINRSNSKDNSFQGVWTFYEDIDDFKPDVLILHFGVDDAYNPVYRSEFKENLVQIIRLARKRFNPQIILLTSHPFESQYEMDVVYVYYRVIREVASDLSCELVSVHSFWAGALEEKGSPISDYVQRDSRYPNERGHELYADALANKLEGIIS